MNDNDKKLKEMLSNEKVPEQLSPENMKKMLDEKASPKKRSGISVVGRVAAGAAACAVIAGSYAGATHLMKRQTVKDGGSSAVTTKESEKKPSAESKPEEKKAYMVGAENYSEIYALMKKASEDYKKEMREFGAKTDGAILQGAAESFADEEETEDAVNSTADEPVSGMGAGGDDYSDTFNQEENVLEADIAKTDGKNIYYVYNHFDYNNDEDKPYSSYNYSSPIMNIASVKDGRFTGKKTIDLSPDLSGFDRDDLEVLVYDMYIYNDMIEVVGHVGSYAYYDCCDEEEPWYEFKDEEDTEETPENVDCTFVSVYSKGESPKLIGTYYQDGYYNDVRIAPDGYMYLISSYSTEVFDTVEDEDDITRYIPACGVGDEVECLPAEDILMPDDDVQPINILNYTVISGIDLNESGSFDVVDSKALAGFSGNIYSSADNIYAACGWEDTDITRIAISEGNITPEASGTVEGMVLDQFSMSEYGGYFRVAATINKWEDRTSFFSTLFGTNEYPKHEHSNSVYVLDMDMNTVGSVTGFGSDENIKSVNFNGDMGYVVTYEQTDPLFAIDISDPADPFITDKFKINGYSTYMQKWDDGLLLGFGVDADSNAVENGIKLVMFDNSDPYDLKKVGFEALHRPEDGWLTSQAVYERKALLIAPEKNIIGFPVSWYDYEEDTCDIKYVFYSYENGEFVKLGDIDCGNDEILGYNQGFRRAMYIGDYVYALADDKFISASIDGIETVDEIKF